MFENIELFNVAQTQKTPYGYRLVRYPESVRRSLSDFGYNVSGYSDSCEIRFKRKKGAYVNVVLMAENGDGLVTVMYGDRTYKTVFIRKNEMNTITLNDSVSDAFPDEVFENDLYNRHLVRLVLSNATFVLCDVAALGGNISAPEKDDVPRYTFVAYGSSITHGSGSIAAQLAYINQTARLLGAQVINKGLGGSCLIEKEVADYITDLEYDFLTFEIGTNMYWLATLEDVYNRGKYLIEQHFKKNPDKYLFLIEPLLPHERYKDAERYEKFMKNVRALYEEINNEKCVLIPADKVQDKLSYLSGDGIHPSTEGHMAMGLNIANIIKPYLD